MSITKDRIQELVKEYGDGDNNSGKTEVQIAILTERINNITNHLKGNKKDHSGRRGLIILVAKRRKLLSYLKKSGIEQYKSVIENLNIRK